MRLSHVVCGTCCAAMTAACSGGAETGSGVESAAGEALPSWSLSEAPLAVVPSGLDPEAALWRVTGALLLESGVMVVADGGSSRVLFSSEEGRLLRSTGGPGEGPEEFQAIDGIAGIRDDSMLVLDRGLRRIAVLAADGGFVRVAALPVEIPNYALVGALGDGSLVLRSTLSVLPESDPLRQPTLLARYSREGALLDTIGLFPGRPIYRIPIGAGSGLRAVPFGPDVAAATSSDRIFVGTGDEHRIDVLDPSGQRIRTIEWPGISRPVTRRHRELHRDRILAATPSDEIRRLRAREFRRGDVRFPTTFPTHARIHAGPEGELWIQEYQIPGAAVQTWTIVDREGSRIARLSFDADLELLHVGKGRIVVRAEDDLGVESVRVHGLVRGGAAPPERPAHRDGR